MAITYRSISTFATVTGSTGTPVSMTLNAPAGVTTDDLLVACISFRGATTPSIPAGWTEINRTQVTGNTNTNAQSIGSGLMAWTKVSGTVDYVFGAVAGEQFTNLAFGYVVRMDGQDLTDPLAGTSVNTLANSGNGLITTAGYDFSYIPDPDQSFTNKYIHILLCIGGQEVTWSLQDVLVGPIINNLTEIGESTSTSGSDGSIAVARGNELTTGPVIEFSATTSAINARHSLIAATFGSPRPLATGYSFSSFF